MAIAGGVALAGAAVAGGVAAWQGEEQRKQANRALGAQPKPPNTAQPDEAQVAVQGARLNAANGRAGTLLAPPGVAVPSIGLGNPSNSGTNTLGG